MDIKKSIYSSKGIDYYSYERMDIIPFVPNGPNKILEIGCGRGATLLKLKKLGKASEIVGVDIHDFEASIDKYFSGDIEQIDLPFSEKYFDVIICADILEHLIDPWKIIEKLSWHLKPGGFLIASIPNIREIKTMIKIFFKGNFEYQDSKILDRTHLRFFCKRNMKDLFRESGLTLKKFHYNLAWEKNLLNKLTGGLFEEFLVMQYIIVAEK